MPTFSINQLPSGLYELRMSGQFFNPHWVGAVFSTLSKLKVAVVEGRAAQDEMLDWDARFELDFSAGTAPPDSLDFVELAHNNSSMIEMTGAPQLTKYEIRPRENAVEVMLYGPYQMGFLGRCLRHISLLGLFPVEIDVSMVDQAIEDRVVLRTISGSPVSDATRKMLENLFHGFLKS